MIPIRLKMQFILQKALFALVLTLLTSQTFGQRKGIINEQVTHFELKSNNDTIDFIVFDTLLVDKKPILLFCQGSLPIPLYVEFKTEGILPIGGGISMFDLETMKKHYHLVIISMPKTPIIVNEVDIDASYSYTPNHLVDPPMFSDDYMKADYLENYVNRAVFVLDFLRKQPWVDLSKLVVAGHSQGSKIAANLTSSYKHVTHVGLFGANPNGRIDQLIRKTRQDAENGVISWEEAEKQMSEYFQLYVNACDKNQVKDDPSLIPWESFSKPQIETWLKIEAPIYLAYGTKDITSDLCDLVQLDFIREHKTNLTVKRYPNLEHSFFEVEENGQINYEKMHWPEVINEFINWTIQ